MNNVVIYIVCIMFSRQILLILQIHFINNKLLYIIQIVRLLKTNLQIITNETL